MESVLWKKKTKNRKKHIYRGEKGLDYEIPLSNKKITGEKISEHFARLKKESKKEAREKKLYE